MANLKHISTSFSSNKVTEINFNGFPQKEENRVLKNLITALVNESGFTNLRSQCT